MAGPLQDPDHYMLKLNDLAEKSGKNGTTSYYIAVDQALFSNLLLISVQSLNYYTHWFLNQRT